MLIRPLLKRRSDLVYHRQYVFLPPLTHYLCGVFFKSGRWGNYFSLHPFVCPLFGGDRYLYFRTSPDEKQFEHEIKQTWVNEPERASAEVCDIIENHALPIIAGVTSPAALAKRPAYARFQVDAVLGACFNGDFDEAERGADAILKRLQGLFWKPGAEHKITRVGGKIATIEPVFEDFSTDRVTEEHRFHDMSQWRMSYLAKLLKTDRSRVPALLHDWEEFTVNAFKLNKYWTRTPFPCD